LLLPCFSFVALQFVAETASDICDPLSTLMLRPIPSSDPALPPFMELLIVTPGNPATG
jgi:hypothetical protein